MSVEKLNIRTSRGSKSLLTELCFEQATKHNGRTTKPDADLGSEDRHSQ